VLQQLRLARVLRRLARALQELLLPKALQELVLLQLLLLPKMPQELVLQEPVALLASWQHRFSWSSQQEVLTT